MPSNNKKRKRDDSSDDSSDEESQFNLASSLRFQEEEEEDASFAKSKGTSFDQYGDDDDLLDKELAEFAQANAEDGYPSMSASAEDDKMPQEEDEEYANESMQADLELQGKDDEDENEEEYNEEVVEKEAQKDEELKKLGKLLYIDDEGDGADEAEDEAEGVVSRTKFMEDEDEDKEPSTKKEKTLKEATATAATAQDFRSMDIKEGNVWYMSNKKAALSEIRKGLFDPKIQQVLQDQLKIRELFAVQRAVVPSVISLHKSFTPGDFCISSPTGSGKTLSYVLPIEECLLAYASSASKKLRAVVVVPTQNLAEQVYDVFKSFERHTGIKVGLSHGSSNKQNEIEKILESVQDITSGSVHYQFKVDVLVATPARLLSHVMSTPGFTLDHLQFLVLDEVDKLLEPQLIETTRNLMQSYFDSPKTIQRQQKFLRTDIPFPAPFSNVRKILCSATLSLTTSKLDKIQLYRPQFFTYSRPEMEKKYSFPTTLTQQLVVYNSKFKPLYLLHLLRTLPYNKVIIFVQSNAVAERLYTFLRITKLVSVALYSRKLSSYDLSKSLKAFKKNKIQVMVCSDAMSRGMDVQDVECVINYEMPVYIKTYIHRVGRTARAEKRGHSITFVRSVQIEELRSKLNKVEGSDITEYHISIVRDLKPYLEKYKEYLREMASEVEIKRDKKLTSVNNKFQGSNNSASNSTRATMKR